MWSGPRNISTTLMYAFAQRADTKVFDEPLYGYYLKNSNTEKSHPLAEEIMDQMECDGEKVIAEMLADQSNPVLFYKHMSHHLLELDLSFMKKTLNILLTRNPVEMLPSYDAVIQSPKIADVGYPQHLDLVRYYQENDIPFWVLDAELVLRDPEGQLRKLCAALGLEFDEAMLSWPKGGRVEDGIWAPYWYKNVQNSEGFMPYKAKTTPFPEHLHTLLDEAQPLYNELRMIALK